MTRHLLALSLGESEIQLARARLVGDAARDTGALVDGLAELDDPFHPLSIGLASLPGRLALVPDGPTSGRVAFLPRTGFRELDPFTFEDAYRTLQRPADCRTFLRELLATLLLDAGLRIVPRRTALVVVVPLPTPLRFRSALWDVLEEAGFPWIRLIYPPEASLLWTALSARAERLEARLLTASGEALIPARVQQDSPGYTLHLGADDEHDGDAVPFSWEAPVHDCLRGALLLGGLRVAGGGVKIARRWRFALSLDGRNAEPFHPQPLGAARPGVRVDFVPCAVEAPEYDPALALYAGLHDALPVPGMAFCGSLRINKFRLVENRGQLIGFVELSDALGVRWGYQLPESGEIQAETLPERLFRSS